ncbi:MAG: outer membrane protein transport protein [Deltaproteobacteria bacterium]|nr:outer membrane protein transport protein [Deltaproteobacteria bacterium]
MKRRGARRSAARSLLVAALLLSAHDASASVFELFGADPRGVAMAGAMAAVAEGPAAAFYNPAALHDAPTGSMQIGWAATAFGLDIHLARPVCTLASDRCRSLWGGTTARHGPLLPRSGQHLQLGWNAHHRRVLGGRLAFGALLTLPAQRLIRLSGPDAAQPHYVLYESLPDRLSILLAVGVRITDWLRAGVGVQVLAALGSALDLDLEPINGRIEPASVAISLQPTARMTAGVTVHPGLGLRFGVGVRQEVSLRYRIPSRLRLGALAEADLLVAQNTLYSPTSLEIGGSWRSADARWQVGLNLRIALWSRAPDPSPTLAIDVGGGAVGRLGLDGLADVRPQREAATGFSDTAAPSLGAEWWARPWLALRTGYSYRPSPVPYAVGLTSQLDNDVHALGLGCEIGFGERIRIRSEDATLLRHAFYLRLGAQAQILPRRAVYRRDPNDPVGDLDHGGSIFHAAAHFGARF